jgi:chaperonin cofactor prefoldin
VKPTLNWKMQALANVEKKVELLTVQVATLEEELQSRDVLLEEVKDEMVHSTDALKVAAEIKQVTDCQTLSKLD